MKKVFLYLSVVVILAAIPLTVFYVGKNQELRKRAAPASTLSFSPSSQTVKAGETFTLAVKIDTATNQVGLVQLRIVYDPEYLEAIDLTNDTLAPSIRVSKKIDAAGKASISVGAQDTTHPISGAGNIAKLTMKALKGSATPVNVKFTASPDTMANALGEGSEDVLIGRTQASVTILNADGTQATALVPTVSASPTATPSATLTITTSPSPTATPTATPADENENTASPSAVTITSVSEDETLTTTTPLFEGTGAPGSTITVIIHSDTGITASVTVDEDGNWQYTPTTPLEPGNHTIEVMSIDPETGEQLTAVTNFIIASGEELPEDIQSDALPQTGATETTMLLIALGLVMLVSGVLVPKFIQ